MMPKPASHYRPFTSHKDSDPLWVLIPPTFCLPCLCFSFMEAGRIFLRGLSLLWLEVHWSSLHFFLQIGSSRAQACCWPSSSPLTRDSLPFPARQAARSWRSPFLLLRWAF